MHILDYCVQCTDQTTKQVGTFAYVQTEAGKMAISPVFPGLIEFYKWAKAEGYRLGRQGWTMEKD